MFTKCPENSQQKQKHITLTFAHRMTEAAIKLAKMTLAQNLSHNLVQNLTFKMARIGPEPILTAYMSHNINFCTQIG